MLEFKIICNLFSYLFAALKCQNSRIFIGVCVWFLSLLLVINSQKCPRLNFKSCMSSKKLNSVDLLIRFITFVTCVRGREGFDFLFYTDTVCAQQGVRACGLNFSE